MAFPSYTARERRLDNAVQGIGAGGSVVGAAALLVFAVPGGDAAAIVSAAVYGLGLMAMFGFSAAYHWIGGPGWKEAIRTWDHAAIFFMIAGTYTPIALIAIGGRLGIGLLAAVWVVAAGGIAFKFLRARRFERGSVFVYLALGGLGLPLVGSLIGTLSDTMLALLGAGAALYAIGVVFHLWESLPHQNAIWHALVLAAAGCHYVLVFRLVAGG